MHSTQPHADQWDDEVVRYYLLPVPGLTARRMYVGRCPRFRICTAHVSSHAWSIFYTRIRRLYAQRDERPDKRQIKWPGAYVKLLPSELYENSD